LDKDKRPTIKDVSKAAGVSVATVSRYLNSSGYVDDSTKEIIRKAIQATHYRINKNAQMLKTRRSDQIMLIVPDIGNPYYAEMFVTLQKLASKRGYSVLLYNTNAEIKLEEMGIDLLEDIGGDGLIYCSIENNPSIVERLKTLRQPIVVSQQYEESIFDTLHSLGGKGIYIAAKYLLGLGHRRIAYVGGPEESAINRRRKSGFLAALKETEITFNKDYCFEMDFTMDAGYKAGIYLSTLPERPTAICAANDILALGVLQALRERGLSVPSDISLTGEDNIEFAKVTRPGLTTINNRGSEFALRASELLFSRIDGKYDGPARNVVCPRELIIRESACAPTLEKE